MRRALIAGLVTGGLLAASMPAATTAADDFAISGTRKAKIAKCTKQANKELLGTGKSIRRSQFDKIVLGGPGPNDFRAADTPGRDLICGFGGDDVAYGADPAPNRRFTKGDVFVGGAGADQVTELYGGIFVGGTGPDLVYIMHWGLNVGGSGDDLVHRQRGGRYYGRDDDTVYTKSGGTFRAGLGNDHVDIDYAGTVFGGGGADVVTIVHPAGKFHGQRGPDLVGYVRGLFRGGRGNDHVCDLAASGRYYGGAGSDKLDVAEVGASWFSVERRVACPF